MSPEESPNHVQLSGTKAMAASQPKRLEPEFGGPLLTLDMNVGRLIAVETREEEPIWPGNIFNSRHSKKHLSCKTASTTIQYARSASPGWFN